METLLLRARTGRDWPGCLPSMPSHRGLAWRTRHLSENSLMIPVTVRQCRLILPHAPEAGSMAGRQGQGGQGVVRLTQTPQWTGSFLEPHPHQRLDGATRAWLFLQWRGSVSQAVPPAVPPLPVCRTPCGTAGGQSLRKPGVSLVGADKTGSHLGSSQLPQLQVDQRIRVRAGITSLAIWLATPACAF